MAGYHESDDELLRTLPWHLSLLVISSGDELGVFEVECELVT